MDFQLLLWVKFGLSSILMNKCMNFIRLTKEEHEKNMNQKHTDISA